MTNPAIEHYTADHVPNPNPTGDLSWQAYHTVRNAVVRCCRRFGPTGPMGECPITTADGPPTAWPLGDPDPVDYFVIDDQYNHERYVYVELTRAEAFTDEWLHEVARTLDGHVGWGVGITSFENGYWIIALRSSDRAKLA